jgi:hypothetical protein
VAACLIKVFIIFFLHRRHAQLSFPEYTKEILSARLREMTEFGRQQPAYNFRGEFIRKQPAYDFRGGM